MGTAGSARRSIRTSTDSTLGRGMNTDAGTFPATEDRAKYAIRTETEP